MGGVGAVGTILLSCFFECARWHHFFEAENKINGHIEGGVFNVMLANQCEIQFSDLSQISFKTKKK